MQCRFRRWQLSDEMSRRNTDMTIPELSSTVRKHHRDLYEWEGAANPPLTWRTAQLEEHKQKIVAELYDQDHGIVPLFRTFLAVQSVQKTEAGKTMGRYMAGIALAAVAAPILWDTIKHAAGWWK
jgi:hypothetical protein